jgi:uncharacterized protein (DUF433 family)
MDGGWLTMTPALHADPVPLRADETGTIRVGDSQVVLDVLVREYNDGADAESIANAYPTLKLGDVYAAIAYYLRHKSELDQYLQRRRQQAAELRCEIEARQDSHRALRAKLAARRAQQEQDHAAPRD